MAYTPKQILAPKGGLVLNYDEFLLEDDQFPVLENRYLRFGKIYRKPFPGFMGRLRRNLTSVNLGNKPSNTFILFTLASIPAPPVDLTKHPEIVPGTLRIMIAGITFTDQGDGTLTSDEALPGVGSTINYSTGSITLVFTVDPGSVAMTATFSYYPATPVMGLRQRETLLETTEDTTAFDTSYAYEYINGNWRELPSTTPTTWTGDDQNFFWSSNYLNLGTSRLFWVTNDSGASGDPIRWYDGTTWNDFVSEINDTPDIIQQCRIIIPFRGRLLMMNTWEGPVAITPTNYPTRIRWSTIGSVLDPDDWRDTIPGRGGYLDLPANENIISAGLVRDNLVIFCERSTWQLRYTGQPFQPFQTEKVNTELGARGAFASIPFDTSIETIGDRGIISCDTFSAKRIDDKIKTFIFNEMNNDFSGPKRIQGIRDFEKMLSYWIYSSALYNSKFPDRILVRNYDEDSWSIWRDSYTALGLHYMNNDVTWEKALITWEKFEASWRYQQSLFPTIIGGNQQGFVNSLNGPFLEASIPFQSQSLAISAISGSVGTQASFTSYEHGLHSYVLGGSQGDIIRMDAFIPTDPYAFLNEKPYAVSVIDVNTIQLSSFNTSTNDFTDPVLVVVDPFLGYGRAALCDNFKIKTKKFNYLEEGQKSALGHVDILVDLVADCFFTMNIYTNYGEEVTQTKVIDCTNNLGQQKGQSTTWQRSRCSNRGAFVQVEYTLSPLQMSNEAQKATVVIHDQILWMRTAGQSINTR